MLRVIDPFNTDQSYGLQVLIDISLTVKVATLIFIPSTLDKLLGQLGIYATWSSSIAYLQKTIAYFLYFLRHVFGSDYIRFLLNEAIANEPTYLLSSSAFLSN